MGIIRVLDQITIDKIAAGEVIERPASIVKELVENAIDAGSSSVIVEIKEGGIAFIRVTDNGCGIAKEDIANAFLRHSTSKIVSADDLMDIHSLGFRGEALSSIAAVSQVELITKQKDCVYGVTYRIEGGKEQSLDETGAPDGTTFLVRQLFYNTPARRKFLKTAMTEASHVGDIITRLALSHPEISFQFINNNQSKIHTSGNGELKDVIYHIYGREITSHLIPVRAEQGHLRIHGYIGEPVISRGNRNFETFYMNGRYVKSSVVSKAIEDAYKDFTMQHKYPFAVLNIEMDTKLVDVNVHPTKMDVRFGNQQEVYRFIYDAVLKALRGEELIPVVDVPEPPTQPAQSATPVKQQEKSERLQKSVGFSPASILEKQSAICNGSVNLQSMLGKKQSALCEEAKEKQSAIYKKPSASGEKGLDYFMNCMRERVTTYHAKQKSLNESVRETAPDKIQPDLQKEEHVEPVRENRIDAKQAGAKAGSAGEPGMTSPVATKQLNLFEERLLDASSVCEHKIVGQVFDTYWIVEFKEQMYIIDQHAAHERVLYEKTLRGMRTREYTSQQISPPIILELSMKELELFRKYMDRFTKIGFEFESFGPDSYAVCAVPDNLFNIAKKELLMEMIDTLSDEIYTGLTPEVIDEKIASMSCKAAVKGKMRLSAAEADALIGELLSLDNPYHCPHGRPTIISMTKRELEKKFKRIV